MTAVRERILNTARQCFIDTGVGATRVQEICELAGVSRTSFYREFRNVDDVLATLALRRWKQALDEVLAQAAGLSTPLDRWRCFLLRLAGAVAAMQDDILLEDAGLRIMRVVYGNSDAYLRALIDTMRPFIERSQIEGVVRTDVSIDEIGDFLLRQIWAVASVPFTGETAEQALARHVERFVLRALMREEGVPVGLVATLEKMDARLSRIERTLV